MIHVYVVSHLPPHSHLQSAHRRIATTWLGPGRGSCRRRRWWRRAVQRSRSESAPGGSPEVSGGQVFVQLNKKAMQQENGEYQYVNINIIIIIYVFGNLFNGDIMKKWSYIIWWIWWNEYEIMLAMCQFGNMMNMIMEYHYPINLIIIVYSCMYIYIYIWCDICSMAMQQEPKILGNSWEYDGPWWKTMVF